MICAGPPLISILFSFPPAKKPITRLSGDQNGKDAPSVPASVCAAGSFKARNQIMLPLSDATRAATYLPSGDTAR